MNMWMDVELLTPRVQHTEEANLRAKTFWVACHFEKSFCTGAEQEIVEDFLVLQNQWS